MFAGILLVAGSDPSWSDDKIGGAEIVINNVQGNLATGNEVPVAQGDNVFLNEAVRSGAESKAGLLLDDNTKVSIGPGSTVKLDSFVYSGPKRPGTIALNLAKGTLRFVTGDASKRAYTIWTPTSAIGVRGTILRIEVTPSGTNVINEEGRAIICRRPKNEYVSVEELRKRPCSKEQKAKGLCGCAELLLPNQQASITQSQIAVTEAPLNAISDPVISEGLAAGFSAPLAGAGVMGVAIASGSIVAEVAARSVATTQPLSP
jgi:hypothetical protein